MLRDESIRGEREPLWWWLKDEEWYKELTAREKLMHWHISFDNPFMGQKEMIRIPRAFEVGQVFAALLEALVDPWHRENPQEGVEWFKAVFEVTRPPILPKEDGVAGRRSPHLCWCSPRTGRERPLPNGPARCRSQHCARDARGAPVAVITSGSSGIGPIKLMRKRFAWLLPVVAVGFSTSARQVPGVLGEYALGRRDGESVELPRRLTEISGLAVSHDGRVWAHDDERATVFELDPASGEIVQSFSLGDPAVSGDFEGIASIGDRLFLVTSEGELYEFRAAAEGTTVPFARHRGLRQRNCEVEGLDHDASTDTLLLVCKTTSGRALRNRLIVFGFSLDRMTALDRPVFAAPLDFLKRFDLDDELNPSGVVVHPVAKTVFVLAARQKLIVELARDGTPLGARELSGRNHRQAEGIVILPDGTLIIADEGGSDRARLTRYSTGGSD